MKKLTLIIPCYNEADALPLFAAELNKVIVQLTNYNTEVLLVNDGSSDQTLTVMKEICASDSHYKYISFSRNFGKEAAIYAGLTHAEGDYIAVMDVDLQDPPSLLPEMYRILKEEDYDSVATRRSTRAGEPVIRSFLSRQFYRFINKISKTEIVDGARDYRLMNRKMADAVLQMSEYNRFSKGIFGWVGFKTKWLDFENVERSAGETKWSVWKLFRYSLEGITGFSVVPLALASVLGILFCGLSALVILVIIIRTLVWGDPVSGWPSMACIVFMVSGVQLLCLGILGQYLSKTYLETKHRPIYLLRESSEEGETYADHKR